MNRIGLYDLLPLLVRLRDAEASDGPDGPILKRILDCIQGQADGISSLISGLRNLIDLETTEPLILSIISKALGGDPPVNLSSLNLREYTKGLVTSHKMKGLVLSWLRQMRLRQLGNYTPVELYKSQPYENLRYSVTKDNDYPYKSSRVTFQAPVGFGAFLDYSPLVWGDVLKGIDWKGILGPLQWKEVIENGRLDNVLNTVSTELLIGQWCHSHGGMIDRQLRYSDALDLLNSIREVAPIHILPPVPACSVIVADRIKETCDGADGSKIALHAEDCKDACQAACENRQQTLGCYRNFQIGCQNDCETSCEIRCERIKQAGCDEACEFGCVVIEQVCESDCQYGCQKIQAGCNAVCQYSCEGLCQINCEVSCEGSNCEIRCEAVDCQMSCQRTFTLSTDVLKTDATCVGVCQVQNCQLECNMGCQSGCATTCEETCQFSCEKKCQNECESFCQERCEQSCQDNCQNYCQDNCEASCTAACQSSCQKKCEGSCQSSVEKCKGGCQTSCQTNRQSTCKDACEVKCQTAEQISGCPPPGGTCSGQCKVPESPAPGEGFSMPRRSPGCSYLKETGCTTTMEACRTSLEATLARQRKVGPCSFIMELPRNPPLLDTDNKATPTIKLTGYKIGRVPVVIYGENYDGKEVAYWGITNESGTLKINVPLKKLTVQPVWFDYPALSFDPKNNTVDFGRDPFPTITFSVSVVPGATRGFCVGLSKSWCGWLGDNPHVKEPKEALGYNRVAHNNWERAESWEVEDFLRKTDIRAKPPQGMEIVGFWNHGQIIFDAPSENLGRIRFLNLYDADYRYVPDGGRLIAWSPMIPSLNVPAGAVLKIPHRSQIFFRLVKAKRKFLGDHIVGLKRLPVEALLPAICEETCELSCQVRCTTHCEIARRDTCSGGCQSWNTTGCQTECQVSKNDKAAPIIPTPPPPPPPTPPPPPPSPMFTMRAVKTWTWDTVPPPPQGVTRLGPMPPDFETPLGYALENWMLTDDRDVLYGPWKWSETMGDPPGSIFRVFRSPESLRAGEVVGWLMWSTWSRLFGIPEDAIIDGVRILGISIYYESEYNQVSNRGYDRDVQHFEFYCSGTSVGGGLIDFPSPVPTNTWVHFGPQQFRPIWEVRKGSDIAECWMYARAGKKVYIDNLSLEIIYRVPQSATCKDNCQTKCESPCEQGCALFCASSCTIGYQRTFYMNRSVLTCYSGCTTLHTVPSCGDSCQWIYQTSRGTGCSYSCTGDKCQSECQFSCQVIEQSPTVTVGGEVCSLRCQTTCQKTCQVGIEISFPLLPSDCHTRTCETYNQRSCNNRCESWIQDLVCQVECQVSGKEGFSPCSLVCQESCQLKCQEGCQTRGQIACPKNCESWVQAEGCVACQATDCQQGCQMEPQVVTCGKSCQVYCTARCQLKCQVSCESDGCQAVCENYGRQK